MTIKTDVGKPILKEFQIFKFPLSLSSNILWFIKSDMTVLLFKMQRLLLHAQCQSSGTKENTVMFTYIC